MTPPADLTVLPVPATDWLVVIDPATGLSTITQALPDHTSPELHAAWQNRMTATLTGQCPLCHVVADPTRQPEVYRRGVCVIAAGDEVEHAQDCPAGPDQLRALEAACSPGGVLAEPDMSESAWALVAQFVQALDRGGL